MRRAGQFFSAQAIHQLLLGLDRSAVATATRICRAKHLADVPPFDLGLCRQARQAERAGRRSGWLVTHYSEVALESLAATDEDAAGAFVARKLAGLEGDDTRSVRLRQTLRAWFAAGHNAAAAAAALGVHEQTVAQRLRTVEERTGRPVAARRAELETALRLRELLG